MIDNLAMQKSHTAEYSTGARTNRVSADNGRAATSTKGCFTTNSDAMNSCGTEITRRNTGRILVYGVMMLAFWIGGNSKAMGQDKKVAVFDPAGSVDNTLKEIVREEISSIIVNTGGYAVLERQLINKVLEENKFQMGGLVDDSQISEVGKKMGANLVFVTNITPLGSNFYISCKMIDVQTGRIEMQKTTQTQKGASDLISVVQTVVKQMFKKTTINIETLEAEGMKIFMNNKLLDQNEVKNTMINTEAWQYYKEGISQNKKGNTYIYVGLGVAGAGLIFTTLWDWGYHNFGNWGEGMGSIGVSVAGVGLVGFMTPGLVLKSKAKKNVMKSVEKHNRDGNISSAELKFNFTGTGIGMVLNF